MTKEQSQGGQAVSDIRQIICERDKEWFQIIESILNFHPVSMTEALKVGIDRMKNKNELIRQLNERIKKLEEIESALITLSERVKNEQWWKSQE